MREKIKTTSGKEEKEQQKQPDLTNRTIKQQRQNEPQNLGDHNPGHSRQHQNHGPGK